MPVNKDFAQLVRRRAFRRYEFDRALRQFHPIYELEEANVCRLADEGVNRFGYTDHFAAREDISLIISSSAVAERTDELSVSLATLESGSLLGIVYEDGTKLRLVYDGGSCFIVLSDSSGALERYDRLTWLTLVLRKTTEPQGVVSRNGVAFPDNECLYQGPVVTRLSLVRATPYESQDAQPTADAAVGRGHALVGAVKGLVASLSSLTPERVEAIASAHGCDRSLVAELVNLMFEKPWNMPEEVMRRLRFRRVEEGSASLKAVEAEVKNALDSLRKASASVKHSGHEEAYKNEYKKLRERYDILSEERASLLKQCKALLEENKQLKEYWGL